MSCALVPLSDVVLENNFSKQEDWEELSVGASGTYSGYTYLSFFKKVFSIIQSCADWLLGESNVQSQNPRRSHNVLGNMHGSRT